MYIQIYIRKLPGKTTSTKINSFKSGGSGIELELSNVYWIYLNRYLSSTFSITPSNYFSNLSYAYGIRQRNKKSTAYISIKFEENLKQSWYYQYLITYQLDINVT